MVVRHFGPGWVQQPQLLTSPNRKLQTRLPQRVRVQERTPHVTRHEPVPPVAILEFLAPRYTPTIPATSSPAKVLDFHWSCRRGDGRLCACARSAEEDASRPCFRTLKYMTARAARRSSNCCHVRRMGTDTASSHSRAICRPPCVARTCSTRNGGWRRTNFRDRNRWTGASIFNGRAIGSRGSLRRSRLGTSPDHLRVQSLRDSPSVVRADLARTEHFDNLQRLLQGAAWRGAHRAQDVIRELLQGLGVGHAVCDLDVGELDGVEHHTRRRVATDRSHGRSTSGAAWPLCV